MSKEGPRIQVIDFPRYAQEETVTIKGSVTDDLDSGNDISLTVNGDKVSVSESGDWECEIALQEGENKVNVEAKDSDGLVGSYTASITRTAE